MKYNLFRQRSDKTYSDRFFTILAGLQRRNNFAGLIRLLDGKCDLTATLYGKADLMKWKAALQEQIGDVSAANQSRALEKQYR